MKLMAYQHKIIGCIIGDVPKRDPKSKSGPFFCGDFVRDPRELTYFKGTAKRLIVLCDDIKSEPVGPMRVYVRHKCETHGHTRMQLVDGWRDLIDHVISVEDANREIGHLRLERSDHERREMRRAASAWNKHMGRY